MVNCHNMHQVSRIRANACLVLGCVKLAWMCVNTWFTYRLSKKEMLPSECDYWVAGWTTASCRNAKSSVWGRTTKIYALGGMPLLLMQVVGYWLNEGLNEETWVSDGWKGEIVMCSHRPIVMFTSSYREIFRIFISTGSTSDNGHF